MRGRHAIPFARLLASLLAGLPAIAAAQTQSTFQVSATIQPGCLVDGVGTGGDAGTIGLLDFGSDSALSTDTHTADATAAQVITLRCTPGVDLTMRIDGGLHAQSGTRQLQLDATEHRLAYQLFRDAGFTQPIGIDQDQAISVTSANADDVILPVYGLLALPGNRPAGVYSDTLLISLDW